MINLNLLPEKEKLILRQERNLQIIFLSLCVLLLGLISASSEIILAKKFLEDNLSIYNISVIKEREFDEKIKQLNLKLIIIDDIQNNYLKVSPILSSLAKITPPDSYLKSFIIDKKKKEFQIKGWAKRRDELLIFQRNLEKLEFFKEIESPLSNLLKEEDINFEFRGKLNI